MDGEIARLEIESVDDLRRWLDDHHDTAGPVWLVTWKKGRGPWVSYDAIVDEAVSFGWIDSRPGSVDADKSRRLLSPRRRGSSWSRVNKHRVERLVAQGRMRPSGLAAVDAARADGSWTALDDVENLVEPDDLSDALDAVPASRSEWNGFPRLTRRAILEWIQAARTAPTRSDRISRTVSEAAVGRRANQWRQTKGEQRAEP